MLSQIEKANKKKQGAKVIVKHYHFPHPTPKVPNVVAIMIMDHLEQSAIFIFLWLQWTKEEEDAFKAKVVDAYEREGSCYYSTARLWDDGVIDPADTRRVLGLSISAALNRAPEDTKFGVFRM